ncbi:MAG: hypothetical protein A2W90_13045 [Bacteroidetes bacterium GWF2_42_66]|nr:MAG: hypothetical protein A2W92_19445 [Bacteroidetes bacterium GWA2_42_15]OFY00147.1 MAG: hypothetical protein A2W89_18035 [Bacteroidetes bacterium GWE2_42_39]OFY40289.1 MAG: hypothetical protein A2W90_13045 [Bacteroidetes bacterium GWF2_42_66]HBL73730.1 CopG family transcriptional regulator [Prolixibacteraceae bacterium]HCR91193.1 CopG family transcriptional regulator [Prolixibacteraceae bacterium]
MNEDKQRLGFVGIIIGNKELCAPQVNNILSLHADIILARTGIPNIKGNTSVITLVINSDTDQLGQLTGQLGSIEGVSVKSGLSKK